MAISVTYHGQRPREATSALVDALEPSSAAAFTDGAGDGAAVTVADGAVSAELTETGLYRVKATSACTVLFGRAAPADATGGETWAADEKEVRYLTAGTKIAVDAAA